MVIVLNDYLVHSCWGLHLSTRFLQTGGSWSTHRLPWVLLSRLWLSYCALVFVCLIKSLNDMLWMKTCSLTFTLKVKVGFICNKCLFNSRCKFCVCNEDIYLLYMKERCFLSTTRRQLRLWKKAPPVLYSSELKIDKVDKLEICELICYHPICCMWKILTKLLYFKHPIKPCPMSG